MMGRKRKDGSPTPAPHYAMALETRAQVTAEMGRCYRAARNNKLAINDLGPLIFTLKTMREGMPEPGAEPAEAIKEIHIQSVPTTFVIDERDPSRCRPILFIEHETASETVEHADARELINPKIEPEPELQIDEPEPTLEPEPEVVVESQYEQAIRETERAGGWVMRPPKLVRRFPKSSF
jgi:hypothetical protein